MSKRKFKQIKYEFDWQEQSHLIKTSEDLLKICDKYNNLAVDNKCTKCPFGKLCDEHKPKIEFGEPFIFSIINQENRRQKLEKLLT